MNGVKFFGGKKHELFSFDGGKSSKPSLDDSGCSLHFEDEL